MTTAKFEARKYYLDKRGNICFVTKRIDLPSAPGRGWLEVSVNSKLLDPCSASPLNHWGAPLRHRLDGVFANFSYYNLQPGEVTLPDIPPHPLDTTSAAYSPRAGTPEKPDPSIDRDRRHLPEAIEGRHLRDHFPDLKDWAVTSGTQAQPKQAVHPLQKWS